MFHKLMIQLAEGGAELALGLLLVASVLSLAIISNRAWFFIQQRLDSVRVGKQLLHALCASDWGKVWAIVHRSQHGACLVIAAGLTQVDRGRRAVRTAVCSARLREQTRLEGQLDFLYPLARSAMLLGLLGTLLDLVRMAYAPGAAAVTSAGSAAAGQGAARTMLELLAPAAAGLVVAIPALLADGILKRQLRLALREIDSLAHLLILQLDDRRQTGHDSPGTERSRPSQAA
jgi:biopolymer transport protein ExbB